MNIIFLVVYRFFCGHRLLIVFYLDYKIFKVILSIDWCLQCRVNVLDILIFEHTILGMQVCEDIQATHCRISCVMVLKCLKIYLGYYGFDHTFD